MTISVFQASDWDDEDAVLGASVGVVADAGENHEEGRRIHFGGVYFAGEFGKGSCTFLNGVVPSDFDFNKTVQAAVLIIKFYKSNKLLFLMWQLAGF